MTIDYVRLVRDDKGIVIDSFDANWEFQALKMELASKTQMINDLHELLDNVRRIALQAEMEKLQPTTRRD